MIAPLKIIKWLQIIEINSIFFLINLRIECSSEWIWISKFWVWCIKSFFWVQKMDFFRFSNLGSWSWYRYSFSALFSFFCSLSCSCSFSWLSCFFSSYSSSCSSSFFSSYSSSCSSCFFSFSSFSCSSCFFSFLWLCLNNSKWLSKLIWTSNSIYLMHLFCFIDELFMKFKLIIFI